MKQKLRKPFIHSHTSDALEKWLTKPSQGILLVGEKNHNQSYVSEWLALELTKSSSIRRIDGDSSIGIDEIRSIIKFASQKKMENEKIVILIPESHKLTIEAQNALLKSLEEPSARTFYILATDNKSKILPTIISRLYTTEVKALTKKEYENAAVNMTSVVDWNLSKGRMNMPRHSESMELAKEFLGSDTYTRLQMGKVILKDKEEFINLLNSMFPIYEYLIRRAIINKEKSKIESFLRKQSILLKTEENITQNVNTKAIFSYLSITL